MTAYAIEVGKSALSMHQQVPIDLSATDGEVIAKVDLVALTSNNITYAVHGGPPLHYWDFFPATDNARCVIPVWGFGTIVESRAPDVPEGLRLFGYWPSATHARLRPGGVKGSGFADTSAHRQALAPVYNNYRAMPSVSPTTEPLVALFQPLYGTGFVLAHSLSADIAAGNHIILTSASSKTALATAFNLKQAGHAPIGLTSSANKSFVEKTGYYSQVLAYENLSDLDPSAGCVLVDFSGNGRLKAQLHSHLKGLRASHIVGDTNWNETAVEPLEGPSPNLFFAPTHWAERAREIGAQAFEAELAHSLAAFLATASSWLTLEPAGGPAAYSDAVRRLLNNKVPPETGLIWRP